MNVRVVMEVNGEMTTIGNYSTKEVLPNVTERVIIGSNKYEVKERLFNLPSNIVFIKVEKV